MSGSNDGGITPMTVNWRSFIVIDAADDRRIGAEPAAPEAVAEDHRRASRSGVSSAAVKSRPIAGVTPSMRKKFDDTRMPLTRSGSPLATSVGIHERIERHVLERVAALAPVEERGVADVAGRSGRAALADHDEPIGIRVRQRAQQHGVEDAEDRGVRADAERQRHERDRREAGRAPQQPRGVAHVARQIDDQATAPRRRAGWSAAEPGGARGRSARAISSATRARSASGASACSTASASGTPDATQLRVVVGDVLRQLVDDVAGARRIDGQRVQPGADERFPVVHQPASNGSSQTGASGMADAGDAVQGGEERAPASALGVEDLLARGGEPVEAAPAHAGLLDPLPWIRPRRSRR